jgi:hypothetical protein
MRDFGPAYDGFGSFSSDQAAPDALGMSALLRSRPNLRTAAIRRKVPQPDPCSAASDMQQRGCNDLLDHVVGPDEQVVGISRPSALAVRKLITRSNLVGSTNGSSPTFSPFRMRPT